MNAPLLMLGALTIEAMVGWPDSLDRTIGHPVRWFGYLVDRLERLCNRDVATRSVRIIAGGAVTAVLVGLATLVGIGIERAVPMGPFGFVIQALLASSLVAARSLYDHVAAISEAFGVGGIFAARLMLGRIVGRETDKLDEAGIARAGIESLAENTSDGVVAPLFWGALLGLPGLCAYKAINTLDSMIGHRSERYEAFGKVAARLDDLVNLIPARLTGLLFVLGSMSRQALRTMMRDARHHRSPNAGWPEAAMAGALGRRLAGPRSYDGETVSDPWLNADGSDPSIRDIERALSLYRIALTIGALLLAGVGALLLR